LVDSLRGRHRSTSDSVFPDMGRRSPWRDEVDPIGQLNAVAEELRRDQDTDLRRREAVAAEQAAIGAWWSDLEALEHRRTRLERRLRDLSRPPTWTEVLSNGLPAVAGVGLVASLGRHHIPGGTPGRLMFDVGVIALAACSARGLACGLRRTEAAGVEERLEDLSTRRRRLAADLPRTTSLGEARVPPTELVTRARSLGLDAGAAQSAWQRSSGRWS